MERPVDKILDTRSSRVLTWSVGNELSNPKNPWFFGSYMGIYNDSLYTIISQFEDRVIDKLGCHMSKRCAWRRSAQRARWKMMSQLTLWWSTLLDDFSLPPMIMGGKFYDTKWQQVKTSTAKVPHLILLRSWKTKSMQFSSCLRLSDWFFPTPFGKRQFLISDQKPGYVLYSGDYTTIIISHYKDFWWTNQFFRKGRRVLLPFLTRSSAGVETPDMLKITADSCCTGGWWGRTVRSWCYEQLGKWLHGNVRGPTTMTP